MELLKLQQTTVVIVDMLWLPCAMLTDRRRCPNDEVRRGGHGQGDSGDSLEPSAIAGHGDGIDAGNVLLPTVMVMVELPEPGAGIVCGLKVTVVPEGIAGSRQTDGAVEATADRCW